MISRGVTQSEQSNTELLTVVNSAPMKNSTEKIDTKDDHLKEDKDLSNPSKEELDKSIKKLNGFLSEEKTHAEYSVHETFNRVMVKIVNDETNEVIMEIPSEKILDAVAQMCKVAGLLVDKKA